MQFSQEVILLRDAMSNAAFSKGYFAETMESDKVLASAKLIESIMKDVMDMMVVDEVTTDDIQNGIRNMHSVLFHKALLLHLSETLNHDPTMNYENYEQVCSSFPFVSWSVYIRTVLLCNWHNFFNECSSKLPDAVFVEMAKLLVSHLKMFDEVNAIVLRRSLLRRLIVLNFNVNVNICHCAAEIICDAVISSPPASLSPEWASMIFELLSFFCITTCDSLKRPFPDKESVQKILNAFLSATELSLGSLDFNNPSCPFNVCLFSVKKLSDDIKSISSSVETSRLEAFLELIDEFKTANNIIGNENVHLVDSLLTTDNADFNEDGLDKLVESIKIDINERIMCFLTSRCHQLSRHHVHSLMKIGLNAAKTEEQVAINTLCVKAFTSWHLDIQDTYRSEHHKEYGLSAKDNEEKAPQEELTDIINRLSLEEDVLQALVKVMGTLSKLCLIIPMETIKTLVDHAIKQRQSKNIVQILSHLRGTCEANVSDKDGSLLTYILKSFIVAEDTQARFWNNFKLFIEELIQCTLLDVTELVEKSIVTYLIPSNSCWRVLQILKLLIDRVSDEDLQRMWQAVEFGVILFLVAQIFNDCFRSSLNFHYDSIDTNSTNGDPLKIKEEAHNILKSMTDCLNKYPHLISDAGRRWLLKSSIRFCKIARFRLKLVVGVTDTQLVSYGLENFSLEELLEIVNISSDVFKAVVNHLRLNWIYIFTENNHVTILCAYVKIIATLTRSELRSSMDALIMASCKSDDQDRPSYNTIRIIKDVTEALIILLGSNHLSAEPKYILDFTTTVTELIDAYSPPSNDNLTNIFCMIVRLSTRLKNQDSLRTSKMLVVHLLKRIFSVQEEVPVSQLYIIMSCVRVLDDSALLDTVKSLSKSSVNISNE